MRGKQPIGELSIAIHRYGNGPKRAILLHGFPDDPGTFAPILDGLLADGFSVVTPYLRGYGPSPASPAGRYRLVDLGKDVLELMDGLHWDTAVLIGHDWGAFAAYMAANMAPERIEAVVGLAAPPGKLFLRGLSTRSQQRRSRYMAFFQLGRLAEETFRHNDLSGIERLWREWSPSWDWPADRLGQVKATFTYPHTVTAALSYYRQLLPWGPKGWLPWVKSYQLAMAPMKVPTLVLHGAEDGCIGPELFYGLDRACEAYHELHTLMNCGHFLQWEQPDQVLNHTLQFLKKVRG